MTAVGDALARVVREDAAKRAALAAVALEARLNAAAPPCYEWIHDEPGRPFPPHERLDTYAYEEQDDPGLSSYPPFTFVGPTFFVGDHKGCSCSTGIVPRTTTVRLTGTTATTITYTADTRLAGVRNPPRPGTVGFASGGASIFAGGQAASDTPQDDPARRSTWFRDAVAQWPELLARG